MIQLEKFDTEQYGSYIFLLTDICKRILVEISETPTAVDIDESDNNVDSDDNIINNLLSENQGMLDSGLFFMEVNFHDRLNFRNILEFQTCRGKVFFLLQPPTN